MARRRQRDSTASPATATPTASDEATVSSNNDNDTNERKGRKMAGLTPDQIAKLLGGTRTKGDYTVKLNEFLASGEAGINVNETWLDYREKKAATLKQGFEKAKNDKNAAEGADKVKVLLSGEKDAEQVFLINLGLVQTEDLETAGAAA